MRAAAAYRLGILVGILALSVVRQVGAQDERTIPMAYDRFGHSPPGEHPDFQDIRRADRIQIEFNSTAVVDPTGLLLPDGKELTADGLEGAFAYPADPALIRGLAGARFRQLPPGRTTLYAIVGRSDVRIRITPLDDTIAETALSDSAHFEAFRKSHLDTCYEWSDKTIGGQANTLKLDGKAAARLKPYHLVEFPGVTLTEPATGPYLLVELLENRDTSTKTCGAPHAGTGAVAIIQVKNEMKGAPFVRITTGLASTDNSMDSVPGSPGSWVFTTKPLSVGEFDYRICYRTAPGVSQSAALIEACIPDGPVHVEVHTGLPSRIRLQPGVFAVNQARDVRLSINLVFITNPSGYFGRTPRTILGGVINPELGFQLGGSTNQIVALMGLHIRLIDEAGLTAGLRFGNETSSTKYDWRTNWYVGFSLDPALFDLLNNRRTGTGAQ